MKKLFVHSTGLFCFLVAITKLTYAQTGIPTVMFDPISVSTFAGSGVAGHADGTDIRAQFYAPGTITTDAGNNIYVTGFYNNSMRRITPAGVVTTIAGGGNPGLTDGLGSAAQYNGPLDAETDAAGNVYNVDIYSNSLRQTTPSGQVTTLISEPGPYFKGVAVSPSGVVYYLFEDVCSSCPTAFSCLIYRVDGFNNKTLVYNGGDFRLTGIYINKFAVDAQGNFYFANSINNKIQKLSNLGVLTTIGGTGAGGTAGDGGLAVMAEIGNPRDIDVDSLGNVYISTSDRIRKISPAGIITTIAGSSPGFSNALGANAAFGSPDGIKVNAQGSIIYVADGGNHRIRKMSAPVLIPFIAAFGEASAPQFFDVSGMYLSGNATVTAPAGYEISLSASSGYAASIDLATISFSGSGFVTSTKVYIRLSAANALGNYSGNITLTAAGAATAVMAVTGSVTFNGLPCPVAGSPIVMFDPISVSTFAGSGTAGHADGTGTGAQLYSPGTITTDAGGNIYITGFYNNSIRKITPAGIVTTIAGGTAAGLADGAGSAAQFNGPIDIETDANGDVYNVDIYNVAIRKTTAGGLVSTVYHNTVSPYIKSLAIGSDGTIYYSYDNPGAFSSALYKIDPLTGLQTELYYGGDYRATGFSIERFAVDANGNFYIANSQFNKIHKITSSGLMYTIGGTGAGGNSGDGGPAQQATIGNPRDIDVDSLGNVYISTSNRIRKISPAGIITTLAGNVQGFADAKGTNAAFGSPDGIKVNAQGDIIYVADGGNHRIRKISIPVLDNFTTTANTASAEQFFNVSGEYLNGNATVTAPAGYEISLTPGSGYAQILSLAPFVACGSGYVASVKIYIRIAAAATAGIYNGEITITAAGATTATLPVTGTVSCLAPTVPTLSTSSNNNCGSINTTLSIATGSLNSAANWNWYTGSCGGTLLGTGVSIIVTPSSTTTYFARAEGGCVVPGSCGTITVTANPVVTPSVIVTASATSICVGSFVRFDATVSNGGFNPVTFRWKKNGVVVQTESLTFPSSTIFNTSAYTSTALANNDIITCEFTSSTVCASPNPAISNAITMTVNNSGSLVTWFLDADGDNYYTGSPVTTCGNNSPGTGYTTSVIGGGDCDDNNINANPGTTDVIGNGIDDNCNGEIDELPYCTPAITLPCSGVGIDEVVLGSITNNTAGLPCGSGYFKYLSLSTLNPAGNAVSFSVTLRANQYQQVNIYIDYNNDGDFNDTDEAAALGVEGYEGHPATGSFVIPATQPVGNYRVRIISTSILGPAFDACNSYAGEAEDYTLMVTPYVKPPYCTPVVDFPCVYTQMQAVTLGTIVNNNTSCNGGYSDFSSMSTDVLPGGNVNFSINCFGGFNQYANIFVDFTDDGDFDDVGEQVVTNFFIAANTTANGLFAIPSPLAGGNYRLRIVTDEETSPSPTACHTIYGEAEDYTLHVLPVYCTPVIDNPCSNSYIYNVTIGSINNTTACSGYDDYSATQSTIATQGTVVNFSVTSPYFIDQNASIYIDYNSDGDFTDAGEQVAANLYMNEYSTPATGTFQIPPIQAPGSYRMRVVSDMAGNNTDPCHSIFGEVEDYTLIIAQACLTNTWTSAANDGNWNNPANWCSGAVPTASTNAKIPATNTPFPVLTTDAVVNNLEIENGATLSIGAHTLTLNGTVNEATFGTGGTISGSNESNLVSLNNAATYIYFTPGQNILKNLTLGYSAQLFVYGGDLEITANPTPGTVSLGQYANFYCSNLIFKSGPGGTARLAELPVDGNGIALVQIQGQQTVERYIPANNSRAWRLLSVPTYGNGQMMKQAWQEGAASPGVNPNPGYGTNITSIAANFANGFDFITGKGSVSSYNESQNLWYDLTSTNNTIDTKNGYFLYIRGDRSITPSSSTTGQNSTTLRTTGNIYQGQQTYPVVQADKYAVLGNLYPSAIDFTKLVRSPEYAAAVPGVSAEVPGIENLFYVWDPKKISGNSLGAYQSFSATNGFECILGGGSFALGQTNTSIQSGQAFFVHSKGSGGTVTLNEDCKVSGSVNVFRPATPSAAISKLSTRLYTGNNLADANVVVFDVAYANNIDGNDALKMSNTGENLGIQRGNQTLVIEGRQPVSNSDTIFFNMWNMQQQQYQFEFVPSNLHGGLTAWLEDSYLGTSQPVNLQVSNMLNFTVDANAASAAANRFRLVLKQSNPLPVNFISISANKTSNGVQVNWEVTGERGIQQYIVERSDNGSDFREAGAVAARNNAAGLMQYNWLDVAPISGAGFYRIKSIAASGQIKYSAIVKVFTGSTKPSITIAPNPLEGSRLNIQFNNQPAGRYTIRFLSTIGQELFNSVKQHSGGNNTLIIDLPEKIAGGNYLVEITMPDSGKEVLKVLVNTK